MADERCCFNSRMTGAQCLLQEGHPCYSPTRFHRYPTPVERGREAARRAAAMEFHRNPNDQTYAAYEATGCTWKSWCVNADETHCTEECCPYIAAGDIYLPQQPTPDGPIQGDADGK